MSARILVVEDDATLGLSLRQRLELEGFDVQWTRSASEAHRALNEARPDIILSDIRLPDGDGETIMRRHFTNFGLVPVIFMTAYGDIDQAVRLVRDGALNYVTKPFDLDGLIRSLQSIPITRSDDAAALDDPYQGSVSMKKVGDILRRASLVDLPVLLLGETGAGKEVAARYLHKCGPRHDLPFVPVNCGALPSELADSLLFGHERGSFTGASSQHRGHFEEVSGGTLFLDEIGDLPPALQVKLLRVLETREFRRVGGHETCRFEARVICATNRDLEAMVGSGAFREDLWFRINAITCRLPPLRERKGEIPQILDRLTLAAASRFGKTRPVIDVTAKEIALRHNWPGNFREMINRVERAVALSDSNTLTSSDLFPDIEDKVDPLPNGRERPSASLADVRDAAERAHIAAALDQANGSPSEAAERLGISRTTLWEKMRRYKIGSSVNEV